MVFTGGRYKARLADTPEDVVSCQRLRYVGFMQARGLADQEDPGLDVDEFDADCRHMMVEDTRTGQLVCCFRMMPLEDGSQISRSYSAKYYDLEALTTFRGRLVEMGRFVVHPVWKDPAIVRVAWAAMTRFVDEQKVDLLFGCSSFEGNDADEYADAFALLKEKHIAPSRWLPRVKAPEVVLFGRRFSLRTPNMKLALSRMPPLLRTYLMMGGWVSDHAVVDTQLKTLHVFTGVEIARVPKTRARLLRGS